MCGVEGPGFSTGRTTHPPVGVLDKWPLEEGKKVTSISFLKEV